MEGQRYEKKARLVNVALQSALTSVPPASEPGAEAVGRLPAIIGVQRKDPRRK